ncbi:hypothetical protein [Nostoc sp.]|uniref:hypothetical protein n=1 Tax=Nostoc sp. TaxID=1180 RepID=UPI002FF7FB89
MSEPAVTPPITLSLDSCHSVRRQKRLTGICIPSSALAVKRYGTDVSLDPLL